VPVGIGATVGGATGNVIDRLRHGAVVDFVAIGPWPVFNLADAALVAGVGLIALTVLSRHA
jgi:signal peptidase II